MRPKLTYSNVISTVALFLALGGGAALAASRIQSNDIARGAVRTRNLHARAVSAGKLGLGAVHTNQIADQAVNTQQLAVGAVGPGQIGKGAVGSDQLAAGAVGSDQLAAGAVGSGQIAKGAVGSEQIAAGAVAPSNMSFPVQLAASPAGGSFEIPSGSNNFDYPIANGSWEQSPGQVQLLTGAIHAKVALSSGKTYCDFSASIKLDGRTLQYFDFQTVSTSFESEEKELLIPIVDPPAPRTDQLSVQLASNEQCRSGTSISARFRVITLG